MWAMIAVSIALAIWCGGLSFLTRREARKRIVEDHVVEQEHVYGHQRASDDAKMPAELA